MNDTTWAHCSHEARHCVAAWILAPGLRVDGLAVGVHSLTEGIMHSSRVGGKLGIEDLIVSLVGWIGDPDLPETAVWPEPWPVREDAPEHVGTIVRLLGLSEAQYLSACELAIDLVEKPVFKQATNLVARALMLAPQIDFEGLEILREAASIPDHEPIGAAT